MLYLSVFCASLSKMYPKVIASSLCGISVYKSFHGNALLSDSGGLVGQSRDDNGLYY